MDARPILETVARVLDEHGLEAILIGNAAAALQGAPLPTQSTAVANRPRDLAVLDTLEKALHETQARKPKAAARRPQGRK